MHCVFEIINLNLNEEQMDVACASAGFILTNIMSAADKNTPLCVAKTTNGRGEEIVVLCIKHDNGVQPLFQLLVSEKDADIKPPDGFTTDKNKTKAPQKVGGTWLN